MITVDLTQMRRFNFALQRIPEQLHREFMTTTNVVLFEMAKTGKEEAPHKDGALRNDIRVMKGAAYSGNAYTGMIGTDLIYSAQREYGGVIRARNAKFLRFEIDGRVIFTKQVTQAGSHYMEKTQKRAEGFVPLFYQLAVDRALDTLAA